MRKSFTALAALGLMVSTQAFARTEVVVTHTGQAPVNKCGTVDQQIDGAVRVMHLNTADAESLRNQVKNNTGTPVLHTSGWQYDYYTQCKNGKVANLGASNVVVVYKGREPLEAMSYKLPSGRIVDRIKSCGNYTIGTHMSLTPPPTTVKVTVVTSPPKAETPLMEPVMEEREVEVVEKSAAEIEWEAIAGVWVGQSGLANFRGAFGEAVLYVPLGDGWKIGAGPFGMIGSGESRVSSYSWHEGRYGPQLALRHDYMKCHEKTYGEIKQEECLPAGDGIKVRYLWDSVSGGNPVSGYHQKQKGHGVDIYAEHVERTSDKFLWGTTAEAFLYGGGRINSTWSGDKPQNRSYYQVNGFGQWRMDDHWQVRAGLGLAHQSWDKVNYLSLFAEARWDETIMCGPRLSLALNRPKSYKPYGRGKLDTLMGFCRIELGGKMRAWDQERRRKRVQLVQVGMRPVVSQGEVMFNVTNPVSSLVRQPLVNLNTEE